jgi:flagellar hook-basal body complex protein FliE
MNPLAAIRQFITPENRVGQAMSAAESATKSGIIPSQELKTLGTTPTTDAVPAIGNASAPQFNSLLSNLVSDVSTKQAAASQATEGVLTGKNVSLHQAVIAMEEASISFQLMVEVRNKLLDSYQELMRMQV